MFELSSLPEKYQQAYSTLLESKRQDAKLTPVAVFAFYNNRLAWTKASIKSLEPYHAGISPENYSLFLINNGSTDTTELFLNEFSTFDAGDSRGTKTYITQIRHMENKGKPWAFNHALDQLIQSKCDGDIGYVVSIDGDVAMPENWLSDMIICYEELVRGGVNVGQLACDYAVMPGCLRTVNPNATNQPSNCKILPSGIALDMHPDVAGGCLLWKKKDIIEAGGYQIVPSPINGKPNLYGMDDGLINLYMRKNARLSSYLINVRARHWGDYDAMLFPKYFEWKQKNLNPIHQQRISPEDIGVEFKNIEEQRLGMSFASISKIMRRKFPPAIASEIEKLYEELS